jgi:hypothetical protein
MAAMALAACHVAPAALAAGKVQVREYGLGGGPGAGHEHRCPFGEKVLYCRTGLPSPLADSDSGARGDARPEWIAYPVVHSARTAMIAVSRPNAPTRPDTAPRPSTPLLRPCLDWSEHRYHLAGSLGAALISALPERRWITTREASRIVTVTEAGYAGLGEWLGIDLAKLRVAV